MARHFALPFCRLLLAVLVFCAPAMADERPAKLGFGLISVQAADELREMWSPVLTALERRLGMPVTAEVAKDYAGVIWSMRSGRSQVAWFGNKSAIEAVDNADAEVFARTLYGDGAPGYYSYLVVRTESPLRDVPDVFAHAAGLTLGTGDTNSTSGYLVPGYYLFARDRHDPHQMFKRVVRGNHEDNLMAVVRGGVDVATVSSTTMSRVLQRHPEMHGQIRVIWSSPLIPANPMLWRKDLAPDLKEAIRAFFLDYGTERTGKPAVQLAEERAALGRLQLAGFVASDDSQLQPVRQVELFQSRMLILGDVTLAEDERHRRLADIDRQLAVLERAPAPSTH